MSDSLMRNEINLMINVKNILTKVKIGITITSSDERRDGYMNLEELNVKAKRYMGLSIVLMAGFLLYFIGIQGQMMTGMQGDSLTVVLALVFHLVSTLIIVGCNVNAILMFRLLKNGETPFRMAIVRKLRRIGYLLMVFEPLQFVFERIMNAVRTPQVTYNEAGEEIVYSMNTFTSYGGVFLILGGVVVCVALAFEYGVVLQTQADETL